MTTPEREAAVAIFAAGIVTVGDHTMLDLVPGSNWVARPSGATHAKIQALTQNIRYRIDGNEASVTEGFQLAAGSEASVPIPNLGISIVEEAAGAILQYQWYR